MDVSEVARWSGVAATARRHHERKGLITSQERDGARRRFAPALPEQCPSFQKRLEAAAAGALEGRRRGTIRRPVRWRLPRPAPGHLAPPGRAIAVRRRRECLVTGQRDFVARAQTSAPSPPLNVYAAHGGR